ncbi:MAG: NAD-binding protein [Promethearchaeota archaeon]
MNLIIQIELKLKQYKYHFLILFLFWFGGFIYFFTHIPNQDLWSIFLYSLTIRKQSNSGDFGNFYNLAWPILLEVIFFGFIAGLLLEKYNPVITSRIMAKIRRNHTVIVGYSHIGERVIEHCIKNKESFTVVEDNYELVEDLINGGHPIVVGDPTEEINLRLASVHRAKEIFILVSEVRIAIICTEKARKLNPRCPIYVRVHEMHVQKYLRQPEIGALTFSTSQWSMDDIEEWIKDKEGNAIVIGRDLLTHRIAHRISLQKNREIYLFDDENDGIEFVENERLHLINECACFLSDLRPYVDLEKISQVFISWSRESDFDEALYLVSKFRMRYPEIEVFVRIFDDELIEIVKKYGARTFSSSYRAFKLLQEQVKPNSSIAIKRN